ncbi:MAG: LysR family transcriptional regulator [Selenomonadaceae bacterium]|nr:LysR family transcriptional regulator [Selenomonadaceae bacterium]
MELRQLEYFQMASRLKNITRAAQRLRVSQPNITVAIKKLETELGILLFDRSQKQLSLTPEGAVFLSRIDTALRCIEDAVLEVNDYKQLQKGTIKIGIPPMMGAYLVPKILSGFQHLHQGLDVLLFEEGSMSIREKLERDELDFGIVIISNMTPTLNVLPMSRSQLMVCVSSDSPLAKKQSIASKDIARADLIMMKEGSYLREILQERLKQLKITPNVVLESSQIVTIKGLVTHGVGIAFLLDFICDSTEGIASVPLADPIYVDIGLAWKRDRYVSKAAQAFIDFCSSPEGQAQVIE